jgi:hypothetical protein
VLERELDVGGHVREHLPRAIDERLQMGGFTLPLALDLADDELAISANGYSAAMICVA